MEREYKTILGPAVCEFEEKKSRFIASVKPVSCEEEAMAFINELKTKYWDATHNVYAYVTGENAMAQRFSDDGEPSGTAGIPTLEVIKRKGLRDLVVVVTRYFGGTLLGAAGLIRAYGKSASLGIEKACVIRKLLCIEVGIVVEYTLLGKIQNLLMSREYTIKNIIYEQDVEIVVYVPSEEEQSFYKLIEEASNARALVESKGKTYVALTEDGKLIET